MKDFFPLNPLEKALVSAKGGTMPTTELVTKLVMSELTVPSVKELQADGSGLEPLFFDKEGVTMLAVFTDKARLSQAAKTARYCLAVNALELLKRMPSEYGIVINPGCEVGFDISPDGVREIIKDFGKSP